VLLAYSPFVPLMSIIAAAIEEPTTPADKMATTKNVTIKLEQPTNLPPEALAAQILDSV
jgi:hypothetical protein